MIARDNRFHGHNSLRTLYRRGQTIEAGGYLILRHLGNQRRQGFRLAVVVAKKVDKRAVVRNRIRRRLYELFRHRLKHRLNGVDLAVIVFSKDLALVPSTELEELSQPLFARLAKLYG